jgi:hypothetical protein
MERNVCPKHFGHGFHLNFVLVIFYAEFPPKGLFAIESKMENNVFNRLLNFFNFSSFFFWIEDLYLTIHFFMEIFLQRTLNHIQFSGKMLQKRRIYFRVRFESPQKNGSNQINSFELEFIKKQCFDQFSWTETTCGT